MGKTAKYVTRYALRLRKGYRVGYDTHVAGVRENVGVKNHAGVHFVNQHPLNFSVCRKCRRVVGVVVVALSSCRAALLIKAENALAQRNGIRCKLHAASSRTCLRACLMSS